MIFRLIKRLYKRLLESKPKFEVGEVVFTKDNGYVKIKSSYQVGYWYDKKTIITVIILPKPVSYKNNKPRYDVYYDYNSFTKLPKSDIVKLLFED